MHQPFADPVIPTFLTPFAPPLVGGTLLVLVVVAMVEVPAATELPAPASSALATTVVAVASTAADGG